VLLAFLFRFAVVCSLSLELLPESVSYSIVYCHSRIYITWRLHSIGYYRRTWCAYIRTMHFPFTITESIFNAKLRSEYGAASACGSVSSTTNCRWQLLIVPYKSHGGDNFHFYRTERVKRASSTSTSSCVSEVSATTCIIPVHNACCSVIIIAIIFFK
jgi:hypothetical protein